MSSKSKPSTSAKHGDDGSGDQHSTASNTKTQHTTPTTASHNKSEPSHAKELNSSNNTAPSSSSSASTVSGSSNPKLGKTGDNAGNSGKSGKDEDDEAKVQSGHSSATASVGGSQSGSGKVPRQSTDPHVTAKAPQYGAAGGNKQSGASTAASASHGSGGARPLGSGGAAQGKDEKSAKGDRLKHETSVPAGVGVSKQTQSKL